MKVNVKQAFLAPDYKQEFEFYLEDSYKADIEGADKIFVKAKLWSERQQAMLRLEINADFLLQCDRCLDSFEKKVIISTEKPLAREYDSLDDGEAFIISNNYTLDLGMQARDLIILEFPTKHVCREDCKGLCPVCGCNLNTSSCSCDIKQIDPRLEVLKDLF